MKTLLTMLFKLVASSFQKVTDFYEQSSRRVSLAVGAYWNSCIKSHINFTENFVCLEKQHFQQLELFKPISIPFKHAQLMNGIRKVIQLKWANCYCYGCLSGEISINLNCLSKVTVYDRGCSRDNALTTSNNKVLN